MSAGSRYDVTALGAISRLAADDRAIVYAAPGVELPGIARPVYRELKRGARANLDVAAVEAMVAYAATLAPDAAAALFAVAAWPGALVESAGSVRGVLVAPTPDGLGGDPGSERLRYQTIAAAARALVVLHGHSTMVGDLEAAGLLLSSGPAAAVFFTAVEQMRFGDQAADPHADGRELGLLALRVLSGDMAASTVESLPAAVAADVRGLVVAALGSEAVHRPAPADWLPVLVSVAATAPATAPARPAAPAAPATPPPPPPPIPVEDPVATDATPASPGGDAVAWLRERPGVVVGAAVALLVLLVVAIAAPSGDDAGDRASTFGDGDQIDASSPETTEDSSVTADVSTTTTEPETTTSSTLATVDGWFLPTVGDSCGLTGVQLLVGGVAQLSCTDSLALVDMKTGDVTTVAMATTPDGYRQEGVIVGDRYLWWDTVDIAASGLDPPTKTFTLQSRSLGGADQKSLVTLHADQYSSVDIQAAWGERLLSTESLDTQSGAASRLVLRDKDGKEIAHFTDEGYNGGSARFDGIVSVGSVTVDLTRDEQVPEDAARLSPADACTQQGIVADYDSSVIVRRGADGLRVRGPAPGAHDLYATVLAAGDRLLAGGGSGLAAYSMDGTQLWELSSEVAQSWRLFGGIPFIVNASQEVVAVDPATGQEATVSADQQEVAGILLGGSGQDAVQVDSATGNVLLSDPERGLKLVNVPECKVR